MTQAQIEKKLSEFINAEQRQNFKQLCSEALKPILMQLVYYSSLSEEAFSKIYIAILNVIEELHGSSFRY